MRTGRQNRGAYQRERNILCGVAPVLPRFVGRPLTNAEDSLIPGAPDAPAHDRDGNTSRAFEEGSPPHEAPPQTFNPGSPLPRCARNECNAVFQADLHWRVYTFEHGWSANLPLPDYGRFARYPGVFTIGSHKPTCGEKHMANTNSAAHVRVIEETPAYWRAVVDYATFNILDASIFEALQDLLARINPSPSLRDIVFESANPEFYLAHFDLTGKIGNIMTAVGASGLPRRPDTFVR